MRLLARIISTALAILVVTKIMPGVSVDSVLTSVLLAIVLSLLNVFIKPLLIFFTLPITIFTLGLFLLVINAAIILMASELVDGFEVDGFWWAMLFSIVLSVVVSIFDHFQDRQTKE